MGMRSVLPTWRGSVQVEEEGEEGEEEQRKQCLLNFDSSLFSNYLERTKERGNTCGREGRFPLASHLALLLRI